MKIFFALLALLFHSSLFGETHSTTKEKERYRQLFHNFSLHLHVFRGLQEECEQPRFSESCRQFLSHAPFLEKPSEFLNLVALVSDPFLEDSRTFKPHFAPNIRQINNTLRAISDSLSFSVSLLSDLPSDSLATPDAQILVKLMAFHGSLQRILRFQQRIRW